MPQRKHSSCLAGRGLACPRDPARGRRPHLHTDGGLRVHREQVANWLTPTISHKIYVLPTCSYGNVYRAHERADILYALCCRDLLWQSAGVQDDGDPQALHESISIEAIVSHQDVPLQPAHGHPLLDSNEDLQAVRMPSVPLPGKLQNACLVALTCFIETLFMLACDM